MSPKSPYIWRYLSFDLESKENIINYFFSQKNSSGLIIRVSGYELGASIS